MHQLFRASVAVTVYVFVSAVAAQDHCSKLLQYGVHDHIKNNYAAASSDEAQRQMCDAYNEFKKDENKVSVSGKYYGVGEGAASLSDTEVKSIGKLLCEKDYSKKTADDVRSSSSRIVSVAMMNAYVQCVDLSNKGNLVSDFSLHGEGRQIQVQVKYVSPVSSLRPKVTGLRISPDGIKCAGRLKEKGDEANSGKPFSLDEALAMQCDRPLLAGPGSAPPGTVVAEPMMLLIETDIDTIRYAVDAIRQPPSIDQLRSLRELLPPVGAIILMDRACPTKHFQDITERFDGRLIRVDKSVVRAPGLTVGDGTHEHDIAHTHAYSATTGPANGRERPGSLQNTNAAHESHTHGISGTTSGASTAKVTGGSHTHASVNLRMCQRVGG